ncbi:AraC family transcriptional regulator [Mesorhizobium sp. B2-3-4]|uniref:AraC family transcriptional regulator n=1 Tax=Mesorhizobium sp. B2-3-4 TaxID=2589959 RepID=UPI00112D0E3F|nr:AraC family transcriptional regulator [Mesorhizobium sp. B2-3-4]TPM28284.1 AraC family transcriptional regulator [Mesorhizobium sp. B2-3-4]
MIESPENLTILPDGAPRAGVSSDLLSHVLAQIRLTGDEVFSRALEEPESLELDEGQAHIVVVTAGALRMESEDQAPAIIEAGDLLLLPRGPGASRLAAAHPQAAIVACRFWFDPDSLRGMIFALPQCIHIRRAEGAGWVDGMLPFLMVETSGAEPGAALMISRIIDLMVIRTLRSWVHEGHATGWLGGLSDTRIARSLKAIHERPLQRWSITELADKAGMSRSSFCERFTALVGRSPLRYQNEWRLGLARDLLARRDARVGEIGLRIGYESEAAFSRAYKQLFGHPPRVEYALADGPARQP